MEITQVSTADLLDPRQIGWVAFQEGGAEILVKVIRGRGKTPFLSLPTVHSKGVTISVIRFAQDVWEERCKELLAHFRASVGDDYFFNAQPRLALAKKTQNQVS